MTLPAEFGMRGPKVHITISPDCPANPRKTKTANLVPLMFRKKAKKVILDLIEAGIIRKLKLGQKSKFCSRGMFIAKPGGVENGVRLVVDFKEYTANISTVKITVFPCVPFYTVFLH